MLPDVGASPLLERQQTSVGGRDQTAGREERGELGGLRPHEITPWHCNSGCLSHTSVCVSDPLRARQVGACHTPLCA